MIGYIETDRLLLRPLSLDELTSHIKSPEVFAASLNLAPSESLLDPQAEDAILNDLIPNLTDPLKDPLFYTMWLMIEKEKKVIIGGFCFHGQPDVNGCVEIGYGTDMPYRNKGYMKECLIGVIKWLKLNNKARFLIAETEIDNTPSIKVLEKTSFTLYRETPYSLFWKIDLK